ncbi:MAG: aminopeptidase P family protein [Bifidobacteriaceae bacterium]|jgi:Xaa-Pro aminopeptidase|nr:aminopeptidase P family protein [Bifidobacteriaceae bacterium]
MELTTNNYPNYFGDFTFEHCSESVSEVQRARLMNSSEFQKYMSLNWENQKRESATPLESKDYASARREKLRNFYDKETLIVPAGVPKVWSNDMDYLFRPHTAFAYLTGLGKDYEADAVLVMYGDTNEKALNGKDILYIQPPYDSRTPEFYKSAQHGEFWIGPRPKLDDFHAWTGITIKDIKHFPVDTGLLDKAKVLAVTGVDAKVDKLIDVKQPKHQDFARTISELRLVKDPYEIQELQQACTSTALAFRNVARLLPTLNGVAKGERFVEGEFNYAARTLGNGVGYSTIAAAGKNATYLHWVQNNGTVHDGDLFLLDAGIEMDSLYTADITRTIPVNGKFSATQLKVYNAVLEAADEAFKEAKVGNNYSDVHDKAMEVIAKRLVEWQIIDSDPNPLESKTQPHRRFMPHGTGHHLGIDVHDCALARDSLYTDGCIRAGMVFTIEPGLYFREDDELVPDEFKGIGVRIEDDILVTEDGPIRLSGMIPRTATDVEAWVQGKISIVPDENELKDAVNKALS